MINYQKRKNTELFSNFENIESLKMNNIQNYIPIYNNFFSLNETNYNNINLNHKNYLSKIFEYDDEENSYSSIIINANNNKDKKRKKIFIKLSPLLDPFKYFSGKYDINDENIYKLPQIQNYTVKENKENKENKSPIYEKLHDTNNSSYVDGLFYYLSSVLLNNHNFINGIDFYGSFLSIKNNFKINIEDDIEYLVESKFFIKNKNILFKVDDYSKLIDDDISLSNHLKTPLKINANDPVYINSDEIENLTDILNETTKNETQNITENNLIKLDQEKEIKIEVCGSTSLKSSSSCSSRTSHTNDDDLSDELDFEGHFNGKKNNSLSNPIQPCDKDSFKNKKQNSQENCGENCEENCGEENIYEDCEEESSYEDCEEDSIYEDCEEDSNEDIEIKATIPKFPIQVICIENCLNTLDNLLNEEKISSDEIHAIFMQIIMTLLTYQKAFSFTHNDLHTNNIMYNETNKKYIYYCYNDIYYKVPTFGKIFKIIDFNRSIYKYKNNVFCSDSFKNGGDASTQYNTEPYFNENKPRIEPNFSFDLCRLACSIFDYFIDDLTEIKNIEKCNDKIKKIIVEWCTDDKGINILYKNNYIERYPDFKLYKMITRIVHNHTPENQLKKNHFKCYVVDKKNIGKKEDIVNIDKIPKYYA